MTSKQLNKIFKKYQYEGVDYLESQWIGMLEYEDNRETNKNIYFYLLADYIYLDYGTELSYYKKNIKILNYYDKPKLNGVILMNIII